MVAAVRPCDHERSSGPTPAIADRARVGAAERRKGRPRVFLFFACCRRRALGIQSGTTADLGLKVAHREARCDHLERVIGRQREGHSLTRLRLRTALDFDVAPGVDGDNFAVGREQWAAAVAVVDRGIGLHQNRPTGIAADRRDQARSKRVTRSMCRLVLRLVAELEQRARMPKRVDRLSRSHIGGGHQRQRRRAERL